MQDTTTRMSEGQPQSKPTDHDTALTAAALGFAEAISDADTAAHAESDPYPNAGRDSGYVAPVGEDLVNVVTILIAQLQTKILIGNQELTGKIDQSNRALNNMRQADLDRRVVQNEQEDAHRGRLYDELDSLKDGQAELTTLAERSVSDLKKLSTQVGDQDSVLKALVGEVSDVKETVSDHAQALSVVVARIDAQQRWIDEADPRLGAVEQEARQLRRGFKLVVEHLKRDKDFLKGLTEESGGAS